MSVLSATTQQQVEDSLVSSKLLSLEELTSLKKKADAEHAPLLSFLVHGGSVDNEDLTKIIANINKVPYVNLSEAHIEPEVLALLPRETAERYMAVPLGEMQNRMVIAMLDADNVQAVDFLSNKIGRPLEVYAASEEGIRQVLHQYITNISNDMAGAITGLENSVAMTPEETAQQISNNGGLAEKNIKTLVQDSPISKALSSILEFAANHNASDVHIEPLQDALKIRCRIDGVLREIMKLPKSTEPPLVSRIKILANLKIDEHRVPQDGEFTISVAGRDIDLRIAVSPVVWGEQVVIRLLDKSGTSLLLEDMGYAGRSLRMIRDGLKQTNGMILTSGPTGSGNQPRCMRCYRKSRTTVSTLLLWKTLSNTRCQG